MQALNVLKKYFLIVIVVGVLATPSKVEADPAFHLAGGALATATAYWFYRYPLHCDQTSATIFSLVAGTAVNLTAEMLSKEFSSKDAAAGQLGVLGFTLLNVSF